MEIKNTITFTTYSKELGQWLHIYMIQSDKCIGFDIESDDDVMRYSLEIPLEVLRGEAVERTYRRVRLEADLTPEKPLEDRPQLITVITERDEGLSIQVEDPGAKVISETYAYWSEGVLEDEPVAEFEDPVPEEA